MQKKRERDAPAKSSRLRRTRVLFVRKSGKEHSSAFSNLLSHYDEGLVSLLQVSREVETVVKSSAEA